MGVLDRFMGSYGYGRYNNLNIENVENPKPSTPNPKAH